ncbi:hypothetical protein C7A07_28150, partial [Pseudomonas fragi]
SDIAPAAFRARVALFLQHVLLEAPDIDKLPAQLTGAHLQLAGIASRHVGSCIAAMLMLLGRSPSVAGAIQALHEPVLGGA